MQILYHHRTQAEDAQGIHIREIIRALRSQGHHVREVSLVESEAKQVHGKSGEGFSLVSRMLPDVGQELAGVGYNPVGLAKILLAARATHPSFIYERYALHNAAGVIASKLLRVPLILEVNAPLALEQSELGKLTFLRAATATEQTICRSASKVLAVSTPLKRILVEQGVPAEKIEVMINGVDPEHFHGRDTGAQVRGRYGLVGKRVLGFVGWIREWHGLIELVGTLPSFGAELGDVHLLVIGDGPARPALEEAARKAGVADRVHVTGPVKRDDVVDHIAAIDVALQPAATSYASPMKVFEYLAMGKPVLAPRQENLQEILEEGVNALFFDKNDPASLAEKAKLILKDRPKLTQMGADARASIFRRGFLWTKNAARAVELAQALGAR